MVVCSDSISAGKKEDKAGKAIIQKLETCKVTVSDYSIIADEIEGIRKRVNSLVELKNNLIIDFGIVIISFLMNIFGKTTVRQIIFQKINLK